VGVFARAATKGFDQGLGTLAAGAHILSVGGGKSVTGLTITTDKALRYAAFWGAVRAISEDVAKLPAGVYRQRKPKGADQVSDHPVDRVVRYMANPQTTAFIHRETTVAHGLTWGNGYSLQVRDGMGQLRQLWNLAPDRMEVDRLDKDVMGRAIDPESGAYVDVPFTAGDLRYRYQRTSGQIVDLRQQDVFHMPGLSWDGLKGYSVIRQARETIGLGLAAEEHGARFFGQGATSSFILSTEKSLSPTAHARLVRKIKTEKSGLANAWEPWVLEEGLKPFALSMPNDDAQWLETRNHQVTDIARWFRIPPHKLAQLERATNNNIEHQALEYVQDALMGWIGRLEAAMGMQLLGREWVGFGGDLFIHFNVNALLRGDFLSRMQGFAVGRQWGWLSADDVRDLEDMNPIGADHGGDEYLRPMNMTTLGPDGSITQTTMGSATSRSTEPAAAGATA
jgi:HK97 family phage portal protein